MSGPEVQQLTVGPLEENSWLLSDKASGHCVIVDPGDEPDRLNAAIADTGCTLQAIWLTHAHFDHVGGVAGVLRAHKVPVYLHPADTVFYQNAAANAMRWGIEIETPTQTPVPLAEGDTVTLGAWTFDVWHLPGHAPGHVAFIGHDLCVSGDVLFAGSIGRTDLPLSDPTAMHASLQRLATLAPATRVLSGHGVHTTIARELSSNPFLRGVARPLGA